ncbi:MAG: FecR domain-containing protein, partial [Rhodospirillales bacterium]
MAATDDTTGRMDDAAGDGAPISTAETAGDNAPDTVIGGTDNAQTAQAAGAEPIGQVESMAGTVVAVRADGTRVELKTGDSIYQGDTLETSADGSVGVVLADQTTFSMASNGQMVIDQMVYNPASNEGSISMSVVEGVFTFVSGQIAKTDPDAMTLNTPVATIGIRGTQVGIDVGEGKPMNVVLMEEADGFVGEVVVANNGGVQILNQAFQSTNVASSNAAPSQSFIYDTQQLIQNF